MLSALLIASTVGALLVGFDPAMDGPARLRSFWRAFAVIVVIASLVQVAAAVGAGVSRAPEWDFHAFWASAHVAAAGENFYDPANYRGVAAAVPHSEEFQREILDVGFWYPPPLMLFLAPLGFLEPGVAIVLWYAVQLAALIAACDLLARTFVPDASRVDARLLISALVLLVHGTRATFLFAQTNALILALLALALRDREHARSGAWLALAAIVKPWAALLGLPLVIGRRWSTIAVALATGAGAWVLAIVAFGMDTTTSFFASPPSARIPGYVFVEKMNQSLLATVLRVTEALRASDASAVLPIAYVAIAGVLFAATLLLLMRLDDESSAIAWALTIALALIVYPASLSHYSAIAVIPALVVWCRRKSVPGAPWSVAAMISVAYALAELGRGSRTFEAFLVCWVMVAAVAVSERRVSSGGAPLVMAMGRAPQP